MFITSNILGLVVSMNYLPGVRHSFRFAYLCLVYSVVQ